MADDNVAVARRVFDEAWNEGNLDVIDEVCSDDFVDHDPLLGDRDRESAKEGIRSYRQAFPDLRLEILDAFGAGDKVAMRWRATGTFENELMGQQPTGETGSPVEGIAIDRFEGGRIVESWAQWDTLTFMRDIGVIPEGAAAPSGS
jgi:predicted ester cyclase